MVESVLVFHWPDTALYCRAIPSVNVTPAVDLFRMWYDAHTHENIFKSRENGIHHTEGEKQFMMAFVYVIEFVGFVVVLGLFIRILNFVLHHPSLWQAGLLVAVLAYADWAEWSMPVIYAVRFLALTGCFAMHKPRK
jgi:hypothetical protein